MGTKNKKKTGAGSGPMSPAVYLESGQARKLPIHACYVTEQWKEGGLVQVVVSRRHVTGNITAGFYLVDLLCAGVKDTTFVFNEPEESLKEIVEKFSLTHDAALGPCDYTLAHNIIFAGVEFASECGIEPAAEFAATKMILEEDDEKIELIDIECGEDGKPVLVDNGLDARTGYYLRQLQKYAGEGNYEYVKLDAMDDNEEDDEEDEEDLFYQEPELWTKEDWEDFILSADAETIDRYENVGLFIYRKAIIEPEAAARGIDIDEWMEECTRNVTYDIIHHDDYANDPEEIKEGQAIFLAMSKEDVSNKELENLVIRIREAIKKWPRSPIFYNNLYNAYLLLNNTEKAKDIQQEQFDKFPDYLFAKMTYANTLYQQGEADKIPAVFNNQLTLSSLYPEKSQFHISDFIGFTAIQCLYHMHIKDDLMTGIYGMLLMEKATGPFYADVAIAIKLFNNYVAVRVLDVMIEALKDAEKRRGLIELLVG
jgi:hypothetical protein